MRIELVNCEATLLAEIADSRMKRNDIATSYAMALCSSERDSIDWSKVNHAIIDRWSIAALRYIKDRAWRIAEGREADRG